MNSVKSEFTKFQIEFGTNSNSKLVNSKSKSVENSDTKISKNFDFKVPNYRFRFRFTPLVETSFSLCCMRSQISGKILGFQYLEKSGTL